MSQRAFRFAGTVDGSGRLELAIPLPPGTRVEVVVLANEGDDCDDLLQLDFWDSPEDDEDWNNA